MQIKSYRYIYASAALIILFSSAIGLTIQYGMRISQLEKMQDSYRQDRMAHSSRLRAIEEKLGIRKPLADTDDLSAEDQNLLCDFIELNTREECVNFLKE